MYLHGLLPKNLKESAQNDDFILTGADFGRAYLSEGWATQFVKDLFRNYTVCFVGYSMEDPLMTYLSLGLINEAGRKAR